MGAQYGRRLAARRADEGPRPRETRDAKSAARRPIFLGICGKSDGRSFAETNSHGPRSIEALRYHRPDKEDMETLVGRVHEDIGRRVPDLEQMGPRNGVELGGPLRLDQVCRLGARRDAQHVSMELTSRPLHCRAAASA
jgi:hypothetical protein